MDWEVKKVPDYTVPVYRVSLVFEREIDTSTKVTSSMAAFVEVVSKFYYGEPVEKFSILMLDTANHVIGVVPITTGTLTSSLIHPREVFKPAIVHNSRAIILVHNHPSNSVNPSIEDNSVTARLCQIGKLLGIPVLDHIIIGNGDYPNYYSYKDAGVMPIP